MHAAAPRAAVIAAAPLAAARRPMIPLPQPRQVATAASVTAGVPALADAPYRRELEAACAAVRLASSLCQAMQRQLTEGEKQDKPDSSPVTVADYGAQAVVTWSLSRSLPGSNIAMVAEEDSADLRAPEGAAMAARITALVNSVIMQAEPTVSLSVPEVLEIIDRGGSPGGAAGRHWVLDPIDGTRGFVGGRQYSVCLGLVQDGEVILGVLGCPNIPHSRISDADADASVAARSSLDGMGCLFLAHSGGRGAYVTNLWDAASPLTRINAQASGDFATARFMESYESRHSNQSFTAAVAQVAGVTQAPLRMDSQVKYGLLSRGDASIFMRFPPASYREKIWDHCAGFVIVEEAGGRVTDAAGRRLDFSKGRYLELDRGIIAAPAALHERLLAAVAAAHAAEAKA